MKFVWSRPAARSALIFLACFLLNLTWQNRADLLSWRGSGNPCEFAEDRFSWGDKWFYGEMGLLGAKPSQITSLMMLGDGDPREVQADLCAERKYTASLIHALVNDRANARVIAIDKYYGDGCTDAEANDLLQAAVRDAVEERSVPIVVGQPTAEPRRRSAAACIVKVQPGLALERAELGLLQLDADTRRIPVQWPAFFSDPRSTQDEQPAAPPAKSFAFLAAQRGASKADQQRSVDAVRDRVVGPIGRFRTTVKPIRAVDFLCAYDTAAFERTWQEKCPLPPSSSRGTALMVKPIVVVGEESDSDRQPFLKGEVYGAEVQAHYIDALLSGDYLREMRFRWMALTWLLVAIGTGVYGYVSQKSQWSKWLRLLLVWTALSVIAAGAAPYLGYYPPMDLLTTVFLALASSFGGSLVGERGLHFSKHLKQHPH